MVICNQLKLFKELICETIKGNYFFIKKSTRHTYGLVRKLKAIMNKLIVLNIVCALNIASFNVNSLADKLESKECQLERAIYVI